MKVRWRPPGRRAPGTTTTTGASRGVGAHRRGMRVGSGRPVRSSLQQQGWDPCACCSVDEADAMAALVGDWPVGTVVERRLGDLVVREMPGKSTAS